LFKKFKPFKSFKTSEPYEFDGLNDLNYLNGLTETSRIFVYRTLTLAAFSFSPVSKWRPCTASSTDDSLGKQFAVNIRSRITSSREKFDGQLLLAQQSD
jgi:hypothetical protein